MRLCLFPAVCLFLGFHAGKVWAQDQSQVAAWLEQVRPELEKVLGYSLPKAPRSDEIVSLARQVDLEKVLGFYLPKAPRIEIVSLSRQADPDVAACVAWRWPHLKDDALARALQDAQAVMSSATVARLVEGTNIILIQPENQKHIGSWDKDLEKANSPDFLKLALIHQTVRFALDSRYDLARRRQACQDAEEYFALEALIEGRAQWVTRQLARKLRLEETFPLLAERFLHVPDQDKDPALRTISQSVVQKRHWACQQGLAFFDFLEAQGLTDEKQTFSKPPKLTQWTEEPELYVRSLKSKRPDLATILAKLEKAPPPGNWISTQQAWSIEMITQVAGVVEERELIRKIADSGPEGRTLIWSDKGNLGHHVALTITRFATAPAAQYYFGFAQRVIQTLDAKQGVNSSRQSVDIPGIKEAVEISRNSQPPVPPGLQGAASRVHLQTQVLLATWGDTVIEITWYNENLSRLWNNQIMELLLAADR
jgi:hypothetical protein